MRVIITDMIARERVMVVLLFKSLDNGGSVETIDGRIKNKTKTESETGVKTMAKLVRIKGRKNAVERVTINPLNIRKRKVSVGIIPAVAKRVRISELLIPGVMFQSPVPLSERGLA